MKDLKRGFDLTNKMFVIATVLVFLLTVLLAILTKDVNSFITYWTNIQLWLSAMIWYVVCVVLMTLAHKVK